MTAVDRLCEAIVRLTREKGFPPTLRELGQDLGWTSSATVAHHIDMALRQGRITRDPRSPRTIRVSEFPHG